MSERVNVQERRIIDFSHVEEAELMHDSAHGCTVKLCYVSGRVVVYYDDEARAAWDAMSDKDIPIRFIEDDDEPLPF